MLTTIAIEIPGGSAIYVLLTFIALLYCLKKFAWGPVTKMMDTRANQINNDLDAAAKSKADAQKLQTVADHNLKESQAQATDLMENARKSSDDQGKKIVDLAQAHADSISRQAQKDARQIKSDALDSAKDEIADLSVSIASRIIGEEITANKHKELIDDFISELEVQQQHSSIEEKS
ncbi:F0F1 ATP synthase subunit B [Oenococcus sicerae]|uniref:ATP synthase subunit b n=1 Tax=Oenococcus sicerae TaxID=2203724 RepID=A0AAJ1R775_9LACO|nr:F0F1 ATP synthase subunit B [Oenococcus sicerae]MDN6899399.1 ATP synthase F0 subunit B [Oenococcus sicerae]QAS70100.1 F0F1 ATP synthase subunit B [Oenococcus sicerae]VDK13665.1 ATP synthase subunit b {ECO:0000255/HAMAP-Rule:MF_01398} [Oenococcus sicerae]